MKELKKFIILILFASSCVPNENELKYNEFAIQKSPNGNYNIIKYRRSGAMAFSSDIIGTELFEVNKEFKEGKGRRINGIVSEWISNDTLLVYNFNTNLDQPKDTFPIKTQIDKFNDLVIKTEYYRPNSWGGNTYSFDSIWTNNHGVSIKFKYTDTKFNVRTYPYGAVTITSKDKIIESVEAFAGIRKSMNFVYKNPDGTFSTNLPGIGLTTNNYKPIRKIDIRELEKSKIFYQENEILPLTLDIRE